jgi:hypothetical protein
MDSKFNFAADAVLRNKAYPALAEWSAQPYTTEWRQFRYHWPYTVPCELHEHCATHNFTHHVRTINKCTGAENFYTIGLGFFDFNIDYIDLIPAEVFERGLRVLFYYHEGDNPYRIKQRLDALCSQHGLPVTCYQFISGNTAADHIPGFHWFPDHELLYWHRNRAVPPAPIALERRTHSFLCLSRTHKWWRAAMVADLYNRSLLDNSLWSYHLEQCKDSIEDSPIELDTLDIRRLMPSFLAAAPYATDNFSTVQQNDHHLSVNHLYTQTYCSIVLETLFDVDGSGSAFLTEKTFKCLKHGHLFVIAGGPGSVACLRELGYKTFDSYINHSYDSIQDNTKRYQALRDEIIRLSSLDLYSVYTQCQTDLLYNQLLFLESKHNRLEQLIKKLNYGF